MQDTRGDPLTGLHMYFSEEAKEEEQQEKEEEEEEQQQWCHTKRISMGRTNRRRNRKRETEGAQGVRGTEKVGQEQEQEHKKNKQRRQQGKKEKYQEQEQEEWEQEQCEGQHKQQQGVLPSGVKKQDEQVFQTDMLTSDISCDGVLYGVTHPVLCYTAVIRPITCQACSLYFQSLVLLLGERLAQTHNHWIKVQDVIT